MIEPTVIVVDDDLGVRNSLRELLLSVGLAVETFDSAQAFLDRFDPKRPGCLVLDVRMAHMSGLALQRKLADMDARIPIVFLSGHGDIAMAVDTIRQGAIHFVQKPYHEQQLLEAINEALARDAARRTLGDAGDRAEADRRLAQLTEREREIMRLALEGRTSKLIAKDLSISYRTVELHRSRVLEKLGAKSFAELRPLLDELRATGSVPVRPPT